VWRFARDLLGVDASADETTQEVFVRAHAALIAGAAVDKLTPWLLGITRNVAREQHRAQARTVPMAEPIDDEVAACEVDPESLLSQRESATVLAACLASLPDDRRAALLLCIDHALTYDEIASALGWTVTRVRNEVHRARLSLRAMLSAHLNP
jgi:RNA polymerase sigma-70 factor (ECF subfamily)